LPYGGLRKAEAEDTIKNILDENKELSRFLVQGLDAELAVRSFVSPLIVNTIVDPTPADIKAATQVGHFCLEQEHVIPFLKKTTSIKDSAGIVGCLFCGSPTFSLRRPHISQNSAEEVPDIYIETAQCDKDACEAQFLKLRTKIRTGAFSVVRPSRQISQNSFSLLSCFNCQKLLPKQDVKRCSQCRFASYCSDLCQAEHWQSNHKERCRTVEEQDSELAAELGDLSV
jgi:hypothetical protein